MKHDSFSDPESQVRIDSLFMENEIKRDFLEWLFDHSGEIDHISQTEAWDKFQKWLNENEPE